MNRLLEFLGRDPQRSLGLFLRGLGLFVIGIGLIFLGVYSHHLWQVPGMFFLALGCIAAAWGYLGMFANRLYHIFNRTQNPSGYRRR
jgi:hypothetical protein